MKMQALITAPLLAVVLMAGALQAWAGQQRTFGFTGQVDSFNRGGGTLVVEDQVFLISESTLVRKRRGGKGTLSDIRPGTRIGFYPGQNGSSNVSRIWILPRNWKAPPGYAVTRDE